jgi:hypothetical protein
MGNIADMLLLDIVVLTMVASRPCFYCLGCRLPCASQIGGLIAGSCLWF